MIPVLPTLLEKLDHLLIQSQPVHVNPPSLTPWRMDAKSMSLIVRIKNFRAPANFTQGLGSCEYKKLN